jgi:predicted SAM-dependent methyltransferase
MLNAKARLRRLAKPFVTNFLARRGYELVPKPHRPSETSKSRARLAPYCVGCGADLGFGGDPITATAIRVDYPQPYTNVGHYPVQLGGDATHLYWFADGVLDYVYSSHLLEDFEDTKSVLLEWLRVLKPGGRLILFCPDQAAYEKHCTSIGEGTNPHHKHADFSLRKVQNILVEIGTTEEIHSCDLVDIYSWELVIQKAPVS